MFVKLSTSHIHSTIRTLDLAYVRLEFFQRLEVCGVRERENIDENTLIHDQKPSLVVACDCGSPREGKLLECFRTCESGWEWDYGHCGGWFYSSRTSFSALMYNETLCVFREVTNEKSFGLRKNFSTQLANNVLSNCTITKV